MYEQIRVVQQSDVSYCCLIHNCEVKSIWVSQQAVQTESSPLMRLQQSWPCLTVNRICRVRAETWRLSFLLLESFVCGLQVRSFSVECFLYVFRLWAPTLRRAKRSTSRKTWIKTLQMALALTNKNNLLGVLNVGFTALRVWDYSCH